MLLNNPNASQSASNSSSNSNNQIIRFNRGEKASVSVRLRKKRSEVGRRLAAVSRHSGDFGFFSHHDRILEQQEQPSMNQGTDQVDKGDWAYITFPNGVPLVQELRTNGEQTTTNNNNNVNAQTVGSGTTSQNGSTTSHVAPTKALDSAALGPARRTPVKVVTREVPGTNLERMFSASTNNIANNNKSKRYSNNNSSQFDHRPPPPSYHPRQISGDQQRQYQSNESNNNNRRQSVELRRGSNVILEDPSGSSAHSSPASARNNNNNQRRKSEQLISNRRVSGEFRVVVNTNPEEKENGGQLMKKPADSAVDPSAAAAGHPEVKMRSRPTGLGRRSATQINIEQKKKNSYNAALYKSQDNLVKASVMTDEPSLEKTSVTLRKALLWTQRDKIFSRWKERYFVLTKDYLNCFKKGNSKISEMGEFLYKVKMSDLEGVDLLDKRGYLTICLSLPRDGKIYLRKTEGIRDWHREMKECHVEAIRKKRRESGFVLQKNIDSGSFWARKQITDSSSIENWLQKRKSLMSAYSDSTPDINKMSHISPNKQQQQQQQQQQKGPEITLSELSALYQHANEVDDMARPDQPDNHPHDTSKTSLDLSLDKSFSLSSSNPNSPDNGNNNNNNSNKVVVKMRRNLHGGSKQDISSKRKPKIINRLSLMSDIELPDFGTHHNIELEKSGLFTKKTKNLLDSQSNDSGHHSMSTNASLSSSASSKSKESNDENCNGTEIMHKTVVQVRHREHSKLDEDEENETNEALRNQYRRSSYAHGLQITHV